MGERTIRGAIHRRNDARRIYERARGQGHVAALLTQERPNLFTQAVANIEPGARVDIRLRYLQALAYESGAYELVFPMVAGPRYLLGGGRDAAVQPALLPPGMRPAHDIALRVELDAGVPKVEETFWSFKHALKIVHRKAAFPPLGALTVAAMLPASWEKRLLDLNVRDLLDSDLQWADLVFVSAMVAQKASTRRDINRCNQLEITTVGGGPLFNTYRDDYGDVDHLVLGEAEVNLPPFLRDLMAGRPQRLYDSTERPDLCLTPVPLWELINLHDYSAMSIQYSRGCPFNCECCDITGIPGEAIEQAVGGNAKTWYTLQASMYFFF